MLRMRRSLGSVIFACMVALSMLSISSPAFADSASGSSVIIMATIAPVREIVVDDRGVVIEILSNTNEDVTPKVYRNKPDTVPVALSSAIYSSYKLAMKRVDTRRTGVVYKYYPPKLPAGQHTGLLGLASRQSVLLMFR